MALTHWDYMRRLIDALEARGYVVAGLTGDALTIVHVDHGTEEVTVKTPLVLEWIERNIPVSDAAERFKPEYDPPPLAFKDAVMATVLPTGTRVTADGTQGMRRGV